MITPIFTDGLRKRSRRTTRPAGREITQVTPDGLFGFLSSVSCGAFVLTTDQTLVFWNYRAREILGYTAELVVSRRCSQILGGAEGTTLTDECEVGCMMVRSLRAGIVPNRSRLRMRCATGEWKWVVVTPMVVSGVDPDGPLLLYLFGDSDETVPHADVQRLIEVGSESANVSYDRHSAAGDPEAGLRSVGKAAHDDYLVLENTEPRPSGGSDDTHEEVASPEPGPGEVHLTARERQVLSYLALGWDTKFIAQEMGVSWYTARNHIDNLRVKLGASNRLEAVVVAMRLGLIHPQ